MAEGSDALLDWLDRVMTDEFDAKMLGRVGCGYLAEVNFLKRKLRWHEQEMLPVCGESGEERHSRAYEARLDANGASDQVPGGTQRTRMALSGAGRNTWCRLRLGRLGNAKEHNRQLGQHPIEFSCSAQHVVALSSGEAEL